MKVDDENLEKLLDFGFKRNKYNNDYYIYYYVIEEISGEIDCSILVNDTDNNDNRVRFMYYDSCDCKESDWQDFVINKDWIIPNVIFDLIKKGIIEKG